MRRAMWALAGVLLLSGLLSACGTAEYRLSSARAHVFTPPLAGRCWPMPRAARFDFPYQVTRQYRSVDNTRWILILQWDQLSAGEVTRRIEDSLAAARFSGGVTRDGWTVVSKPRFGAVAYRVDDLPGVSPDAVVKGTVRLDLPITAARSRQGGGCTPIPYLTPAPTPDTVVKGVS